MEKGNEKGKGGLRPGTLLQHGKYRIIRYISQGGFGCTYEAEHTMFNERVAIKELFISEYCNRNSETGIISVGVSSKKGLIDRMYRKFVDEARAQRKMQHPNIVRVIDVFEENSTAYYVMDYVEGDSLETIVQKRRSPMPEHEAVGYIRMIADALDYVHANKRLHLDIKPGNIMIDKSGKAILIDFGASKQYDDQGSNASTIVGFTRGYAPIEQVGGHINTFSPASDIFSLGSTLYRLLTGETPVDSSGRISGMKLKPLPAGISPATRRAVECAMKIPIDERPQSIQEFLRILDGGYAGNAYDNAATEIIGSGGGVPPSSQNPYAGYERTILNAGKESSSHSTVEPKKKGRSRMAVYIAIGLAVVAFIVGLLLMKGSGGKSETGDEDLSGDIETFTVNGVPFEMVRVEGGTFMMGSDDEDDMYDYEKPVHRETVSTFWIGRTEVTQALWEAVIGGNPSEFKGANNPVESVSWDDCQEFIEKLNQLTGQNFRLPTEAEWEYAARGGNRSQDYKYSGSNDLGSVGWYDDNSGDKTHPVASKQANELGLYDMSGNVLEWTSDKWRDNYNIPHDGGFSGSDRVRRGGGFVNYAAGCRSACRYYYPPYCSYRDLGFRLAL